jgi:hypothetical protein
MNQHESPFVADLRSNAGRMGEGRGCNRGASSRSPEGSSAREMKVTSFGHRNPRNWSFAMRPSRATTVVNYLDYLAGEWDKIFSNNTDSIVAIH